MNQAEYMRGYRARRYQERRTKIIQLLGGKCSKCGSKENLEIDHIDPKSKSFGVSEWCWCKSWESLLPEIKKCQLLCEKHHSYKTVEDNGNKHAEGTHGTLSSYHYCKCDKCRAAHNEYCRNYKRKSYGYKEKPRTGLVHGTGNAYSYYKCRCEICKKFKHDEYIKRIPHALQSKIAQSQLGKLEMSVQVRRRAPY